MKFGCFCLGGVGNGQPAWSLQCDLATVRTFYIAVATVVAAGEEAAQGLAGGSPMGPALRR